MSRFHSYLNSAATILSLYNGEEPLSSFLKKYFARDKKFGSKDRKQISHLCYCYFRLGKSFPVLPSEEKILLSLFFCSDKHNDLLATVKPGWNEKTALPLKEKLLSIGNSLFIHDIFPWKEYLSDGIDFDKFCESFFIQPDLFLRLRPGKEIQVKEKLGSAGISYHVLPDGCLALSNASKIDNVIELDEEVVVQDYNSQQTGNFIKSEILNVQPTIKAWDCCAGSGGKSIMLHDICPQIQLTVSDKRESILANLKKRFSKAGIKNYKSFIADVATTQPEILNLKSEMILADVPCTGAGTWSRTPEQLFFFTADKIDQYATLQRKIVSNVIPALNPGGYFVYITCSVFKKENEEAVFFIRDKFRLELLKMELLKGYEQRADTMFIAVFKKSL